MNLYVTADVVGKESGGGKVTFNESTAFESLGECEVWGWDRLRLELRGEEGDPWDRDAGALGFLCHRKERWRLPPLFDVKVPLAHFYAGTFTKTIDKLKNDLGAKITYTAAAHDKDASRREHEKMGVPFNYPHLTDPALWERYLAGYKAADVLIVPSTHSRDVVRMYGCTNRIEVIPHGVDLPSPGKVKPLRTDKFVVGYLGACGAPDKGLRYLLEAWAKLKYHDAELLLAGPDSASPWVSELIRVFGCSGIHQLGWMNDTSDFYNQISVYVQPSVTEGFGIEVLEAMAHCRPVICSKGAGAVDVLDGCYAGSWTIPGDVDHLTSMLGGAKNSWDLQQLGFQARERSENFTWTKIRQRYVTLWKELLK